MLRVLVDATALPVNRGGVGRYVDEIVGRLPGLGVDAHVAAQPRDRDAYAAQLGADHVHDTPGWAGHPAPRLGWEQTGLPLLVRRVRPDVLFCPHYTLPLASSLGSTPKLVVTLHDATFFSDPKLHLGVKARFFRQWTALSSRRADALIAPSEATRAEVVRHTGTDRARITVVPHGVDHERFRPPSAADVAEVRRWLGLEAPAAYVAFLGTLEPRKNVPALIRAYAKVCAERPDPPVLVLAGGKGWDDGVDPALAEVAERAGHLRIIRPGFVPDGLVPALLGGATLVAYPAFGEGFGLPVLEAMACGAAVLTTRGLSLAEVGGEAVCYADSPDLTDVADALARLLDDQAARERLGAAGIERAAGYTWDAAARGHLAVFARVTAGAAR
jgi:glycosyltransferase involved in cell wall biosynthesis